MHGSGPDEKMQVWKGSRNMKPLEIKHRVIGGGEPLICVPVVEQDAQSVIREITYLSQSTADMIEWRVDAFRDFTDYNAIRSVFEAVAPLLGEKLFLYTFRTAHQGGMAQVKAEQLDDLHDLAAESGCVDLVDLEFFEEDRPLHKIKRLREMGVSVIASHHDFEQTPSPEVMKMLLEKMCAGGADIVKLAVMPQNYKDVLNLLDVTAQFREENPDTPVITMSMGSLGGISRISGETFGSCVTFGAHEKPSAPGQFAMKELRQMLDTIHASSQIAISLCYYNVLNYVTVLIINKVVKYGRIVCGFISGDEPFRKTTDRRSVFRYDKKRRHDALGNFTAESGKRRRKSHGVRIGGEASYQEFCCVKDFEESGGSWVDLQNDRSE